MLPLCLSPTWLTRCPLDTRPACWPGHPASVGSHDAPGACTPLASPSGDAGAAPLTAHTGSFPALSPGPAAPRPCPAPRRSGTPGSRAPAPRSGEGGSPKPAGPDARWPAASGWRALQGDGNGPPRPRFNSGTRGAHGLRQPLRGRGHSRSPVSPLHSAPGIR